MARQSKTEKPWERQPKESPPAYEAFYLYLEMGSERSLRKVAQKLGKSSTLICRWSSTWNWQQRSREYDTELQRKEFAAKQQEIKKARERQLKTAVFLQKKAVEALNNLDIEDMEPKDILRFITEGIRLEREVQKDEAAAAPRDDTQTSSLAETIVSAYKRRMGE